MYYVSYTATKQNGDFICESNLSAYGCRVPGRDIAPRFVEETARINLEIKKLLSEGWSVEFTSSPLTEDDLEMLREFNAI